MKKLKTSIPTGAERRKRHFKKDKEQKIDPKALAEYENARMGVLAMPCPLCRTTMQWVPSQEGKEGGWLCLRCKEDGIPQLPDPEEEQQTKKDSKKVGLEGSIAKFRKKKK